MNDHIAALLRIQRTRVQTPNAEPIRVQPGPFHLAPEERWCRRCGEQTGDLSYCPRCGSHQIVPARAVLKPAEYYIAS